MSNCSLRQKFRRFVPQITNFDRQTARPITQLYQCRINYSRIQTVNGISVINLAIDAYYKGPNWIANETIPIGYYQTCGNYHILVWLRNYAGRCSAGTILAFVRSKYECMFYNVFYESKRAAAIRVVWNLRPFDALLKLLNPFAVCFALLGAINYIIMTRVQKQIEGGGSGSLLFHQAEIVCDIAMVLIEVAGLFSCDFLAGSIHTVAGMHINATVIILHIKRE